MRLSDSNSRLSIASQALCPLSHCRAAYWFHVVLSIYDVLTAHYTSRWVDSTFAFTTLLPSVERQCPHCLLVTTFLFSRIGSYSSDASVISKMRASRIRTRVCPLRVRRFVHWATAARPIDFMLCWQRIIDSAFAFTTLILKYDGCSTNNRNCRFILKI